MYRLLWKRDDEEDFRWYIRGICDDGRIYGEVRFQSDDPAKRRACAVETAFTESDRADFQRLARSLPFNDRLPTDAFAFIAQVEPDGQERGIFAYDPDHASDNAATFRRLVDLIRPYIEAEWRRYW